MKSEVANPMILKNGTKQHQLTQNDRRKGGSSRSPQKSIAARLRVYNNPDLNCQNCKNRCFLYDETNDQYCYKAAIINRIRSIARSQDPLVLFDEMFDVLSDMRLDLARDYSDVDKDGTIKYTKQKIYLEKLIELQKIMHPNGAYEKLSRKITPHDVAQLLRENNGQGYGGEVN